MNLAHNLGRGRSFFADRPAILFEGRSISYRELDESSNRLANALIALGINRGDRVAIYLPNIPEFVVVYYGVLKTGAVAVSINSIFKQHEVAFIVNDSGSRLLFSTAELAAQLKDLEAGGLERVIEVEQSLQQLLERGSAEFRVIEMQRDDPALILYTSGTTGFPKGATLSHGNVVSNTWSVVHHAGYRPDDRLILFLPLFHVFGQNFIMNACFLAGSTLVLHRRFVPDSVLDSIARDQVTMFFGVPSIYVALLNLFGSPPPFTGEGRVEALSSIRYWFSAAATMPQEISRRWTERFGSPIFEGYGLTETSPFAAYNHDFQHRFGSVGTAVENFEIQIVDETGEDVPTGSLGEIAIKGPGVMLGYWGRPQDTSLAIRDGWFHSGDIGSMDDQGYVFIVDRVKDMINRSGFKIWPAEVEQLLYRHPAVKEAAVYAVADAESGEAVAAAIVLRDGASATALEITEYCRARAAVYKAPTRVDFVSELPRNPTGKILKRVLRERAAQSQPAPAP
ncbi:MAG TPA: long-chain fatty acid--CoA ligase [Candidatus Dormibacteraeota bacterium]|nr:long-chain fatty acid--CoA ligase [Candidatus Dormibacteraeota bacterium]